MTAIHHHAGIRCIHIHGWETARWCHGCRLHWHHASDEDFTQEEYERESDVGLAHAVLTRMEGGEIPLSPLLAEFDLGFVFEPRMAPGPN